MDGSVSYDRVADIYDATRALPDAIQRALTEALLAEIATVGAEQVVEVGVGTGRIARPLAEQGVRVLGLDIAPRMLATLRRKLGPEHVPPTLAIGDATRLPLASGCSRAVLILHVLHLVSSLERAVGELRRALAPGGVVIRDNTVYLGQDPWQASAAKWDELMAGRNVVQRARPRAEEIRSALRAAGGSCRTRRFAEGEEGRTPRQNLDRIRERIDSWSWEIPDDLFADCLAEFEPWYRQYYGDMDRAVGQTALYQLEVWSFG